MEAPPQKFALFWENMTGVRFFDSPLGNVLIADNNDILAETESDEEGIYSLSGTETEAFTIQPFIGIAHFCPILLRFPQKVCFIFRNDTDSDIFQRRLNLEIFSVFGCYT